MAKGGSTPEPARAFDWGYQVPASLVEHQDDGATRLEFDLSGLPIQQSIYARIQARARSFGPGLNPSLAVWLLDAEGRKIRRVREVTFLTDWTGTAQFPVSQVIDQHLRQAASKRVAFRIEARGPAGFSQQLVFEQAPILAVYKTGPARYAEAELFEPVWTGKRILSETLLPTAYGEQAAEAQLAFVPSKILSVQNYARNRTYIQGRDFVLDGRNLRLTADSAIPFHPYKDLYHQNPDAKPRTMQTLDGGYLTFSSGGFLVDQQLVVSYEHTTAWNGPVPGPAKAWLPRSFQLLESGQPLKLVVFGDSISFGGDASAQKGYAPWLPRWSDLLVEGLERHYGSEIDAINPSLGGTRSDWGRKTIDGLVSFERPDLVILGFGMNDGGGVPVQQFVANTQAMMDSVRAENPEAEFILLMSFQPNPKWRKLELMESYLEALQALEGPGVALADMWSLHEYLLQHKTYWDMSTNHVNHPNDFLVRVYAQLLLARLGVVEWKSSEADL